MSARRRRHTPEQIIRKPWDGEKQLGAGAELSAVLKHLEITEAAWYRWRNQYGGMKADDAKRLKELEQENARFSRMVAPAGTGQRHAQGAEPGETGEPRTPPPRCEAASAAFRDLANDGRAAWWASTARRGDAQRPCLGSRAGGLGYARSRWPSRGGAGAGPAYWVPRSEGQRVKSRAGPGVMDQRRPGNVPPRPASAVGSALVVVYPVGRTRSVHDRYLTSRVRGCRDHAR